MCDISIGNTKSEVKCTGVSGYTERFMTLKYCLYETKYIKLLRSFKSEFNAANRE